EVPDVVLMDIGLPDGSGLELAREFRALNKNFLLLFLSALNDPDTKVEGLEIGAEDYITKPFALKELTFRLEKSFQLKAELKEAPEEYIHGPLIIRFSKFQVVDGAGQILELGQKECAILKLLYSTPEVVFSREEIIGRVWGENKFPSNRTVDNYIVKLRKWCETDKDENIEIQSIRGIGYKLCLKK
ncbi:MAG: response regulator transcription factor, partial [Halobacteriovoraceae bacterium]|nr:response regulator transcription factor [Halobacteriovoraceae bacterium]